MAGSRSHGANAANTAITAVKSAAAIRGPRCQRPGGSHSSANGNSAAAIEGSRNCRRWLSARALISSYIGTLKAER